MDIELFRSERLAAWGMRLKFPPQAVEALQAVASLVRDDEELRPVFAEFHKRTALQGEWHREWSDLPAEERVQARLGERTSLFYLLAYMSALPYTEAKYRQLGVGMDVFDDTMTDFRIYLDDFYDLHGHWGYDHFMWIWRHLTCKLFRLGRLQYMLATFDEGVTAFRRKFSPDGQAQKSIVLLADPDRPLRPDGYAYGAGQRRDDDTTASSEVWNPVYEVTEAGWRGHPINPYGYVLSQPVFLPRLEWDLVLGIGDTVLDIHIPRKDPLTVETCRASQQQAVEFFPRVFPERPSKAFFCHTWFFTIQLQTLLPPESNIVRFQREFYLYPRPGGLGYLWAFVFGAKYPDPATAPRDTFLRRAVLDWIAQGKEIFDLPGLMFHAPEQWGTQPYMRQWEERKDLPRFFA